MELRARKGASANELRADLLRLTFVTAKEAPILTLRQRSARSQSPGLLPPKPSSDQGFLNELHNCKQREVTDDWV